MELYTPVPITRFVLIGLLLLVGTSSNAQSRDTVLSESEHALEDVLAATSRFKVFRQQTLDKASELVSNVQALEKIGNDCEQSALKSRQEARQIQSLQSAELARCVEQLRALQFAACSPASSAGPSQSRITDLSQSCHTINDAKIRQFSEILEDTRQTMASASVEKSQLMQQRKLLETEHARVQRGARAARARVQSTLQSLDTALLIAEQEPLANTERIGEIRVASKRLLPGALPELGINAQGSISRLSCDVNALQDITLASQQSILQLASDLSDQIRVCVVKASELRTVPDNNDSIGTEFDLWSDPGLPGGETVPVETSAISEQRIAGPGKSGDAALNTTSIKGYGTSKRQGKPKTGKDGQSYQQNNMSNQGAQQRSKREEEIAQDYADPPS